MNRIITLAAVALMAMSANAQIESWNAVAADGTIDSQFGADGAWNNDLTLNPTSNVTVHFLSSGNPIEVEKSGSWATVCPTQEQWPNYSEASYKTENINIDSVDATGAQVGKRFYAMHGTGVPYTMFVGEEQMKDGASTGYWYVKSQEFLPPTTAMAALTPRATSTTLRTVRRAYLPTVSSSRLLLRWLDR